MRARLYFQKFLQLIDFTLIATYCPWWDYLHHGKEKILTQCYSFLPKSQTDSALWKFTQLLGSTGTLTDFCVSHNYNLCSVSVISDKGGSGVEGKERA